MMSVQLCDTNDNCQYYSSSQLAANNFASTVAITDSQSDTTPPQLISLTFQQSGTTLLSSNLLYPDMATVMLPITVTLQASDIGSGVGGDIYGGCNYPAFIEITSQNQFASGSSKSSSQFQYAYFSAAGPNSWTATLDIPPLSEIGTWNVFLQVCDKVGNSSSFTGPTSALGPVEAFVYVLYATSMSTQTVMTTSGGVTTGTTKVTDSSTGASVTIPPGVTLPTVNPALSVTVTPSPTSVNCQVNCTSPPLYNGFKATTSPYVDFSFCCDQSGLPIEPFKLAPPGATIVIPDVFPPGTTTVPQGFVLFSFDGGNLHPTMACQGGSLNPSVDQNLGTVTFHNVCDFSVFVVLQKTGVPGDVNGDGVVNCADVDIVKAAFGTKFGGPGFDARADVNNDGVVNILDLAFVLRQVPAGTVCH